jgi:hypothetical protein
MTSHEDLFMEIASLTPVERQDAELDGIIEGFVSSYGALHLAASMSLNDEVSENFGCTVRQVAYDVVRHHLEQYWLSHRQAWYVKTDIEAGWWGEDNDEIDEESRIAAGPFATEERAQKALDALFEDHPEDV